MQKIIKKNDEVIDLSECKSRLETKNNIVLH